MDTDLSTTLLSAADNQTRTLANLSLGAPNMQPGSRVMGTEGSLAWRDSIRRILLRQMDFQRLQDEEAPQ